MFESCRGHSLLARNPDSARCLCWRTTASSHAGGTRFSLATRIPRGVCAGARQRRVMPGGVSLLLGFSLAPRIPRGVCAGARQRRVMPGGASLPLGFSLATRIPRGVCAGARQRRAMPGGASLPLGERCSGVIKLRARVNPRWECSRTPEVASSVSTIWSWRRRGVHSHASVPSSPP